MTSVYVLGAVSVAALSGAAAYLWHLLADFPLRRRLVNLLLPLSQLVCVAHALVLAGSYEYGPTASVLSSVVGIACAVFDPLLYRSLLGAERVELERERARFLEEQVELQARHLERARAAEGEAQEIRGRLDHELALLEDALRDGSPDEIAARLDGAEQLVRSPGQHVCEHQAADALILDKLAACRDAGIRTTVRAEVPDALPTPAVELCAVLANALDNAIDACSQLPVADRWIELDARPTHGFFHLDVRNSCASGPSRRRRGSSGPGALPEHGWGLSVIEAVARRHEGSIEHGQMDGAYRLSVIWKL